jgi:hypothetical protein
MTRIILAALSLCPVLAGAQVGADREVHGSFVPDTSAAGILLCDSASSIAAVGHIPYAELRPRGSAGVPDRARFRNEDGTQILTLIFHPGTFQDEYAEITISTATDEKTRSTLPLKHFESGRGVRLGMSEAQIISLFGNTHVRGVGDHDNVLLTYSIQSNQHTPFLDRFGYEAYHASFLFQKDRLINYHFGFEMP